MISKITSEIIQNPAAAAAVVAALIALAGSIIAPTVQLLIGSWQTTAAQTAARAALLSAESAGIREIARMRLSWLEKLRDTLSEFHSILMSEDPENYTRATNQKLTQLGTQLDLLLNQDDRLQKQLWDITDRIYKCDNLSERNDMDE